METLVASIPMVDDGTGLDITFAEMAWDKGRGKLWAGTYNIDLPTVVYLLDPTTGEANLQFKAVGTSDWPDGLAYD
jgi:hypothetical protein